MSDEHLEWVEQLNAHMDCGCYDTLTALAAEVRRLRGELQDERLSLAPLREAHAEALNAAEQNEAALAALRQSHAEAVKASWDEAWNFNGCHCDRCRESVWLASDAKARLT